MSDEQNRERPRGRQDTGAEPTVERQELSERLLGLIGGYEMGAALNAEDMYMKTAPGASAPDGGRDAS